MTGEQELGVAESEQSSNIQVSEERPTHIVGVGASAGGLEALERLFEAMPPQTGMAFAVVQHLSPDFKSLTDELLGRRTRIPIHRVEDGMEMRRDAIYLLPPKKNMIVVDGKLRLTDKDPREMLHLPIDHFFRSLAQDAGERAIGIVLSGTGSDGSRGIRDIHEAGGLVIAQTPESAKFDGMPKSAVHTRAVHFVLPPEEIPTALLRYIKHPLGQERALAALSEPVAPESAMESLFRLLRDAYDIDFSHYKPETVARRTQRRLLLKHAHDLEDYVSRLARDTDELNALYRDLLIGVTRFFRDRDAWENLQQSVLGPMIDALPNGEELRIWVAGCATGEEAYSLAILVHECFEARKRPVAAKIFATDVHRASLEQAAAGVFSDSALADLAPGWRTRYFVRKGDEYQVTSDLRQTIVFAQHNLVRDAPFTRIDLITCRNLLIYLKPIAQRKILSLFHFGLRSRGVLFLGPSESPGELSEEFDVLDGHWKVYRKRRDVRLPNDVKLPSAIRQANGAGVLGMPMPAAPAGLDGQLLGAYDVLLDEFMPPSFLVDEKRELIHSFGGASQYLKLRDGRFSKDVLDMVEPELRVALAGALPRAFKEQAPVIYKNLRVLTSSGEQVINVTVKPVANRRNGTVQALVCLSQPEETRAPTTTREIDLGEASREHMLSLESELRFTKENLQATIEELETSNEELQATNEELVAANEELQSTNEELHSVNEELYTVNGEYQKKIAELTELTADVDNLLSSSQIHTIFLDRGLRIRKFTPSIAETFNLLPQDLGRRIDSFTHGIDDDKLLNEIQEVLRSTTLFEKQVRDHKGNWFLLRIVPYQKAKIIDGVVLTLIDISSLKTAQAATAQKDQQLAAILKTSPNFLCVKDLSLRYIVADDAYRSLLGQDPVGKTAREIFPPEIAETLDSLDRRAVAEGTAQEAEMVLPLRQGPRFFLGTHFPLRDDLGRIIGVSSVKTDITQLKEVEAQAREAVRQRDQFLAMLSHELRNPVAAILNAATVLEMMGPDAGSKQNWHSLIERRARHMARLLDDLLDVSRVTQGKIEIRKEIVDLRSVAQEAVEQVRSTLDERCLQLSIGMPAQPVFVDGDPDRLQQIYANLLLNACKYTPAKGHIGLTLEQTDVHAVVRINDSGCGIAPDMLEKVFELFVQANAEHARGGIGVGLTLVRSLVQLHGGQVTAQSEGPGKGSEFIVRLPLAQRGAQAATPAAASRTTSHRARLLLIEDDADICESLQLILQNMGYTVRSVRDGESALAAFEQELPDVALVDIGLPGMNGNELARRVRQRWNNERLKLIAVTGYGQQADRRATREAGFDHHLTKPLKLDDLTRLLDKMSAGVTANGQLADGMKTDD